MVNLVVARYLDGRVVKGQSLDVAETRPTFHVRSPEGVNALVEIAELKALFFVRDLDGNAERVEGLELSADDIRARGAHPIELEFADGERITGFTVRYPPIRRFFYIVPADTSSNNIRILVNRAAVVRLAQPEAEIEPPGDEPA
jgi:hypothetical protein